jgi:hypothetical protein
MPNVSPLHAKDASKWWVLFRAVNQKKKDDDNDNNNN